MDLYCMYNRKTLLIISRNAYSLLLIEQNLSQIYFSEVVLRF